MRHALAAAALLLAAQASAFGPAGHRAVAQIAAARLDPAARAAVDELLGTVTMADISSCSDGMIYGPLDCAGWLQLEKSPQTMKWHFINIPISEEWHGLASDVIARYCPRAEGASHGECVTGQLDRLAWVLADRSAPRRERQIALMHVVHLMGDLHQPLHVADDSDWGGNKKVAHFHGLTSNLHALWDAAVTPELFAEGVQRWRPGVDGRAPGWMFQEGYMGAGMAWRLEKAHAHQRADVPMRTVGGLIGDAALESYELGRSQVYAAYRAPDAELGVDYEHLMRPLAMAQIRRAGIRLAHLLNQTLGKTDPAAGQFAYETAERLMPIRRRVAELRNPWAVVR